MTFDLTGLPPKPEEVRAFLGAPSPAALDRVVAMKNEIARLAPTPGMDIVWDRKSVLHLCPFYALGELELINASALEHLKKKFENKSCPANPEALASGSTVAA